MEVTGSSDSIPKRNDPSTWGTFETWEDVCGAITAEFTNTQYATEYISPMCMMCNIDKYPTIQDECNDGGRRLAKDVWSVFDAHKERRRLRATSAASGSSIDNNSKNPKGDARHGTKRDLQTCPIQINDIGYPLVSEAFYTAIVGPLLLPIALDLNVDVSGILAVDSNFDQSDYQGESTSANVGAVLTQDNGEYNVRTDQVRATFEE